jgi:hypothetical protein
MTMQAVQMRTKALRTTISLVIGCFLLIPPLALPSCERPDPEEESCCCCCCPCCDGSELSLSETGGETDDCSCEINESKQEEDSPAVVSSHHDGRVDILLPASRVEGDSEDYGHPLIGWLSTDLFLPGRDQPLYILHSSLLI